MSLLQLPDRPLSAEEILPLISQYALMPQFMRGLILDQAIASIDYTAAEREQFVQQLQGVSTEQWLQQQGMNPDQYEAWIDRQLKINKFQQETWGRKLESYFLTRKNQLDAVVCSLIHVSDWETAWELYFRIAEGEQSFAECARDYSQGPEAHTQGIVGPIELGQLHPDLVQRFYGAQSGHLWEPLQIGDWIVIARLETFLPAQLDASMQQRLLNELLETWLHDRLQGATAL